MRGIDPIPVDALSPYPQDGAEAARPIWDDEAAVDDTRRPAHAGVRARYDRHVSSVLRASPGLINKMIKLAAAAAEDLAVAQFQGLIEVIQNADDVRATEVRFALRETKAGRRLLIVREHPPQGPALMALMARPLPRQVSHSSPSRRPLPPQLGHTSSPVPGVPGGGSSPGAIMSLPRC
jgi:uncharacterized protein (DUF1778 family)